MNIMAGIVTFNPELDRLKENIEAITPQLKKVLIVDNGSKNISDIESLAKGFPTITIKRLNKNRGIAEALNEIGFFAKSNNYEWFLTLDQDSVSTPHLIEAYRSYLHHDSVGQLTCTVLERGTGLENFKMDASSPYVEVDDAITSGSLVKTDVFDKIGGFDTDLFIDTVDTDFNYRLIQHQFKTIRINHVGLLHELGKTKQVTFLGREHTIVSHSPARYYYIFRNEIILTRRYKSFFNYDRKKFLMKYMRSILVLDNHKLKNFIAICRGVIDGLIYKI